ncbi:nicotinate phosphoribosyltransferase [Actinomarinicola tropica]|uniref:nicotinate phosphoribosyltransferase n=1 Tax=Actinomarinicola tropica TaxID=2789776 RepID=UPI0038990473
MVRTGSALFTDLYELTMAAGYVRVGIAEQTATFDLFVRRLPEPRQFLVAAGLADAVDFLTDLSIDDDELAFLESTGRFAPDALDAFARLTFTGDLWGVPEGEVVFGNEPILRVTAPLIQAQVVETRLINLVASQTMVASKAARVAIACGDRTFVDFSARRDHGGDAAMQTARASYVAGAAGTSLVAAGHRWGIPLSGTMAHAYVMSFDDERDAFRTFARTFPDDAVLLIDTYDTEEGARRVVEVAAELADDGIHVRGVRLDSGDLAHLSRAVRAILDEGGMTETSIFASGDLDEYRITELLASGSPIDAFGVGTQLGTSADAPNLGGVYKLVADASGPKMKLAEDKVTLPGLKQVWRVERDGRSTHDVIALDDEEPPTDARPLLHPVLRDGALIGPLPSIDESRRRAATSIAALPSRLRTLQLREAPYDVRRSAALDALVAELTARHRAG